MFNAVSIEFIKLRRSNMLVLAVIASILPVMVRLLQYRSGKSSEGWEVFLASGQEMMVFCMLTTVVLVSSFVFNMEYRYNTASSVFTTSVPRGSIYFSKVISVLAIIILLFLISALSNLLFGYLAVNTGLPRQLLAKYLKVLAWYVFSYFMISTIVIAIAAIVKKFVISAIITLAYLMLVFPYHLKGNAYICPFMTPTAVAAKIMNSSDYIFTGGGYYKDIAVNFTGAAGFLMLLGVISLGLGILFYTKNDPV